MLAGRPAPLSCRGKVSRYVEWSGGDADRSGSKGVGSHRQDDPHYEAIGLVPSAERRLSNYRDYDDADVHRLRFIRRSRDLGFSMERIRDLLKLWSDRHRCSSEVKTIALAHVAEMETRIAHMREMADVLHALANACEGNGRPECPIIQGLEGTDEGGLRLPAYLPPGSVNH